MARDQGLAKISRRTYRWWVAVMWLLAGTAAAVLFLLPTWTAGQAGAAWGIATLIVLHLIAAGLRFQALGKSCGCALLLFMPLVGQGMYVWLLFADRHGPGHGSFPRSVESASDAWKRARAERISAARSRSRPNTGPDAQPKSPNRPSAAEWVKAASDLR